MDEKVKELYLAHHGVKGQKWGIRRYQNEDGTLTSEGQARYGNSTNYGNYSRTKGMLSSYGGFKEGAEGRANRFQIKANKAADEGNEKKREKFQSKADAQKAANANMQAYLDHKKSSSLIIQSLLNANPYMYRKARARGSNRLASWVEANVPILGTAMHAIKNKRAYGRAIIWADREEGINFKENFDE